MLKYAFAALVTLNAFAAQAGGMVEAVLEPQVVVAAPVSSSSPAAGAIAAGVIALIFLGLANSSSGSH